MKLTSKDKEVIKNIVDIVDKLDDAERAYFLGVARGLSMTDDNTQAGKQ